MISPQKLRFFSKILKFLLASNLSLRIETTCVVPNKSVTAGEKLQWFHLGHSLGLRLMSCNGVDPITETKRIGHLGSMVHHSQFR